MAHHIAYLAPSASGSAAMLHGNTEWISSKTIMKVAPVYIVLSLIVIPGVTFLAGSLFY